MKALAALLIMCVWVPATTRATSDSVVTGSEWRFTVLLDGKTIGYHQFALSKRSTERELISEARFKVKFFFIDAYSYAHDAKERWQGECLSTLEARTNDNGHQQRVQGARGDGAFLVATGTRTESLPPCVQTFAYWNPQILKATHLLNPQTGVFVPVDVTLVGVETVAVRGRPLSAERYRIVEQTTSRERLQIDLWYSTDRNLEDKQWLALESLAVGGKRLRYQMQ
jgi:hypothetical protein